MARKTIDRIIHTLLPIAAAATFAGCSGCENGDLINTDDDDDSTPDAPYTADDISLDCYATEGDLEGDNPYTATEGTGVLCAADLPDNFEGSAEISASDMQNPDINNDDLTAKTTFDMYDANLTVLEDGSEVSLGDHVPTATLKIRDDPYIDDMDITATFDPVYLENQAPTVSNTFIDMGLYQVGETIPGFDLLQVAGAADREQDLDGNGDFEDDLGTEGNPDQVPGMSKDGNQIPDFSITEPGDFEFDYTVVDPQGKESETVTLGWAAYSNPVVPVTGIGDFLYDLPLSNGYVWVYCEDEGTPDFMEPGIFGNPFELDVNGEIDIEIISDALAAGAQLIDCYFAVDNDVDQFDVSSSSGVIFHTQVTPQGTVDPVVVSLLVPEGYDGNAQAATGVDDSVEHLLTTERDMRANEGLPDLTSATDMIWVDNGLPDEFPITCENTNLDNAFYLDGISTYANAMDQNLMPNGSTPADLFQDSAGGQISVGWDYDAGVLEISRVFSGTTINSGEVLIDNTYELNTRLQAEGMFIVTGAIAGTPAEGDVLDENRDFSNGTAYEFDIAQKQLLIRQLYQHDLDQICVEFDGYNPCDGIMPNYFGDGQIDN